MHLCYGYLSIAVKLFRQLIMLPSPLIAVNIIELHYKAFCRAITALKLLCIKTDVFCPILAV